MSIWDLEIVGVATAGAMVVAMSLFAIAYASWTLLRQPHGRGRKGL
jgi:hypothetical protein